MDFIFMLTRQDRTIADCLDLFDLIRLGVGTSRLEIENLLNAFARKNVVDSFNPLYKAEPQKDASQVAKANIRVRAAPQHPRQKRLAHRTICARGGKKISLPRPVVRHRTADL